MRITLFYNGLSNGGARGWAVKDVLFDHQVTMVDASVDVNSEKFLEWCEEAPRELFIVAGFPQIFKPSLLSVPKHGVWNCHAGPLPEYRGGSPLNWQIIDGKEVLGVSLIKMDEGIDTGPIIDQTGFTLHHDETIREAHAKANLAFASMVSRALKHFPPSPMPQGESQARYRKQRTDADGEFLLTWPPELIHNHVRALTHPYPGAWFRSGDRKVRVWSTSLA